MDAGIDANGIPQERDCARLLISEEMREPFIVDIQLGQANVGLLPVVRPVEGQPFPVKLSRSLGQLACRVPRLMGGRQRPLEFGFHLLHFLILFFSHIQQLPVRLIHGIITVLLPDLPAVLDKRSRNVKVNVGIRLKNSPIASKTGYNRGYFVQDPTDHDNRR